MSVNNADSTNTNETSIVSVKAEPRLEDLNSDDTGSHFVYSDYEQIEIDNEDSIGSRQEYYEDQFFSGNSVRERKRTRNFTQSESNLLCNLLEDYFGVLDNRSVDYKTNHSKVKAWAEITEKFNSNTDYEYRTASQLRTFYENLKKKRRRALTEAGSKSNSEPPLKKVCPNIQEFRSMSTENLPKPNKSFGEQYERKRLELVELEIEKTKKERDQQKILFLLQEEKLKLEIEELKTRLRK